jgi:Tol biopolymer transport system component
VNFDAEISAAGQTLYAVDGQFSARGIPRTADIFMARRHGDAFVRMEDSDRLLKLVNTEELEYAPAISSDGLELFFTRVHEIREDAQPRIWRAVRSSPEEPFAAPSLVSAIEGFAEGPALSPDGLALYYHAREKGRFAIFRVTRQAKPAGLRYGCP